MPSSDLDMVIVLPKVHVEAAPEGAGGLEGRNTIKENWQQNLARSLSLEAWVDMRTIKVRSEPFLRPHPPHPLPHITTPRTCMRLLTHPSPPPPSCVYRSSATLPCLSSA